MASGKQYRGEAAVHAFVSRLLLRGHNPGRPLFDEGAADDLYISMRGRKTIIRVQVKSREIKWHTTKKVTTSTTVSLPASIADEDAPVDLVAVCLWDVERWHIGVFDGTDIRSLLRKNVGSQVRRKPPHGPELHFRAIIDLRGVKRVTFSGIEVTRNFAEQGGRWDELFPSRFP